MGGPSSDARAGLDNEGKKAVQFGHSPMPYPRISILIILISSTGFSLYVLTFSILCITSNPWTARPKMVCLPSSHGLSNVSSNYQQSY